MPVHYLLFIAAILISSCGDRGPNYKEIYREQAASFDKRTNQEPVLDHKTIDEIVKSWEKVVMKDRPDTPFFKSLKEYGQSSLTNKTYYMVRGDEIHRYVVGEFRLYLFVTRDDTYYENLKDIEGGHEIYFLCDPKMLHILLDLMLELGKMGLDPDAVQVRYAYRSPETNRRVLGAKGSRHKHGDAIDLYINDLNRNGKVDAEDKQIVMDLLDKKLLKNKGGMGRYPGSQVVHFDTRGHRARWDKQGSFDGL